MPVSLPHTPNPPVDQAYTYSTRRGRPVLFQVTDPTGSPLWPYLLALHVNPRQFDERMQKSKSVTMTYGGFVEFHWPDELGSLSATASTGAFFGPNTGLTSGSDGKGDNLLGSDTRIGASGRQHTMAWERQEDLLDLFRNNGLVFNGFGEPVLRGQVMCIYDRGIFRGLFTTFSVKENDEKAFSFELDWEFKVEATVYIFPASATNLSQPRTNASRITDQRQYDLADAAAFGAQMGSSIAAATAAGTAQANVGGETPQEGDPRPQELAGGASSEEFTSIIVQGNQVPDEEGG
jgi:hypothetical protein